MRDVCTAAGLATLVASVALESWRISGLLHRSPVGNWVEQNIYVGFAAALAILVVQMLMNWCFLLMVC